MFPVIIIVSVIWVSMGLCREGVDFGEERRMAAYVLDV